MTDKPNTTNTCPTCGHMDTHTPMIGCLHADGTSFCDCTTNWTAPKTHADARRERDAAMAQVHQGTDPVWAAAAEQAVVVMLRADNGYFTADDVWDALTTANVPAPREPRALGPILRRLANDGTIQATGFTESRRRHGAPVRVYVAGPAA